MEKHICHDCKKELKKGDEFMGYFVETQQYIKCRPCNEKDPTLRNFATTEVYSRVCGYMRPVEQWNKGKQEEFKDRKEFKI